LAFFKKKSSNATIAPDLSDRDSLVSTVKEYMSEPRHRIRLDDIVGTEIRKASYEIREEEFPMNTASISKDDIAQRLQKYHNALSRLTCIAILLGKWGSQEHQPLI
jgi:hypothetical protein